MYDRKVLICVVYILVNLFGPSEGEEVQELPPPCFRYIFYHLASTLPHYIKFSLVVDLVILFELLAFVANYFKTSTINAELKVNLLSN